MKKMSTNKEEILDLAIINHKQNNFQSAEDLYNKVLDVDPDHVEAMFLLGTMSVQTKNFDRAQKLLKKVIEIQPNHSKAHNNLGTTFQELKKDLEAINYYEKAIKLDPNLVDAYCNLALLYMNSTRYEEALLRCDQALNLSPGMLKAMNIKSEVLNRNVPNWHIAMMNDAERNNFYLSALKSVIKDDSNVLEIGSGSGLLSIMAANLGAKEVNSCETNSVIANKAMEIIKDNNLSNKINIISKKSNDIKVGEDIKKLADVLVSEIFSSSLLGEDVIPSLEDAKQRLISKNAKIIPEYGSIMIALFGGEDIGKNIYTENFEKINLKKFNNIIPRKHVVHREDLNIDLLSNPLEAFRFDFVNKNTFLPESKKIEIKTIKNGKCYGVIQWIKMEMNNGLKYENNPENLTKASGWQRILYNFDSPIELSSNQKLIIEGKHDRNLVWFFLNKIIS